MATKQGESTSRLTNESVHQGGGAPGDSTPATGPARRGGRGGRDEGPPRGRRPHRQRGELDTRERLVLAATELFSRQPPSAVSTRAIAELAGVQQPLIFHYFSSKDELVTEVITRFVNGYLDAMEGSEDAISGCRDAMQYFLEAHGGAAVIAYTLLSGEDAIHRTGHPVLNRHADQLSGGADDAVRRQVDRYERPRDPRLLAAVLMSFMAGWAITEPWALRALERDGITASQARHEVKEIIDAIVARETA